MNPREIKLKYYFQRLKLQGNFYESIKNIVESKSSYTKRPEQVVSQYLNLKHIQSMAPTHEDIDQWKEWRNYKYIYSLKSGETINMLIHFHQFLSNEGNKKLTGKNQLKVISICRSINRILFHPILQNTIY